MISDLPLPEQRARALKMFDAVYAEAAASRYWQRQATDAKQVAYMADTHAAQLEDAMKNRSAGG